MNLIIEVGPKWDGKWPDCMQSNSQLERSCLLDKLHPCHNWRRFYTLLFLREFHMFPFVGFSHVLCWISWPLNWWGSVPMCVDQLNKVIATREGTKGDLFLVFLLHENKRIGKEYLFGSCCGCVSVCQIVSISIWFRKSSTHCSFLLGLLLFRFFVSVIIVLYGVFHLY